MGRSLATCQICRGQAQAPVLKHTFLVGGVQVSTSSPVVVDRMSVLRQCRDSGRRASGQCRDTAGAMPGKCPDHAGSVPGRWRGEAGQYWDDEENSVKIQRCLNVFQRGFRFGEGRLEVKLI